jgi:hypothetical protein
MTSKSPTQFLRNYDRDRSTKASNQSPLNIPMLQTRPLVSNSRYEDKSRNLSNLLSARNTQNNSLSPRINNDRIYPPSSYQKIVRGNTRQYNSSQVSKLRSMGNPAPLSNI